MSQPARLAAGGARQGFKPCLIMLHKEKGSKNKSWTDKQTKNFTTVLSLTEIEVNLGRMYCKLGARENFQ